MKAENGPGLNSVMDVLVTLRSVLLNCRFFCGDGRKKKLFTGFFFFFVCFWTPQRCSKMLQDDSLCFPRVLCAPLLWRMQHIMDMWTDESLDYKCMVWWWWGPLCRRGRKKTSRLFGSAGPSQRPDQILYLAETKGIVRIRSGFKKQSEWGNGGALAHIWPWKLHVAKKCVSLIFWLTLFLYCFNFLLIFKERRK